MDFHEVVMKGKIETDNIKSKNGADSIDIEDSTGKATLKQDLRIESGSDDYVLVSDSNGDCSFSPRSIPKGNIFLFESDTAIIGYTLLTNVDDALVYQTIGSAAGGEAGGTFKSGGSWSIPSSHNHTIPTLGNHTHSPTNAVADVPSHRHWLFTWEGGGINDPYDGYSINAISTRYIKQKHTTGTYPDSGGVHSYELKGYNTTYGVPNGGVSSTTGSSSPHNHGNTGSAGSHNHSAGSSSFGNTWRPRGRNYTRQYRP